jgi:hypothetical protein
MMFVSLMPLSVAFFRCGRTLRSCQLERMPKMEKQDRLRRVGRVNDDGLLRLVIGYEICIVVASPLP